MSLHKEYLDLLKKEGLSTPEQPPVLEEWVHDLRNQLNETDEAKRLYAQQCLSVIDLITYQSEEQRKQLRNRLNKLSSIEDGTREFYLFSEDILDALQQQNIDIPFDMYINVYPTGEFNARAVPSRSGVLCLLNKGLTKLIYHLACASCYPIRGSGKQVFWDDHVPSENHPSWRLIAVGFAARFVKHYLNSNIYKFPVSKEYPISPHGLLIANKITYAMKMFIVAHEVSHILLGHVKANNANSNMSFSKLLHGWNRSHMDEFKADRKAQQILIWIANRQNDDILVICGGICFFIAHLIVLHVTAKLNKTELNVCTASETHPATSDRIKILERNLIRRLNEHQLKEISILVSIMKSLLEDVKKIDIRSTHNGIQIHGIDRLGYSQVSL